MSASSQQRLIFAADYPDLGAAETACASVAGSIGVLKIGLELYVAHGPAALQLGKRHALPIFLDLKLHDIPATVGRAVARAATLGVRYLTVHASGGEAMLKAACEAAAKAATPLTIIAVTVLTSLDDDDMAALGVAATASAQARSLAKLAWTAGVRAFVCSPAEAASLRADLGPDAIIITPGVRPQGSANADQKRVMTPADAIRAGADMLVVGRPIRDAADPSAAARAICAEIDDALRNGS